MSGSSESRTVVRALSIVDCFSLERPELGVREVARRLGLAASTTARLLATLQSAGVLTKNARTRAYTLGPRVLAWAGIYTSALDVRAAARPILERLRRATRETVTLYVRDGDERVCVERLEGPENIRAVVQLGQRLPCYAGAGGKVLLAFLPDGARDALLSRLVLRRFTTRTVTTRARLERDLAAIRRLGYAATSGERFVNASAIAAPIFGVDGVLVAVVNISGPAERFTRARSPEYIRQVVRAARDISRAMGHRPAGA